MKLQVSYLPTVHEINNNPVSLKIPRKLFRKVHVATDIYVKYCMLVTSQCTPDIDRGPVSVCTTALQHSSSTDWFLIVLEQGVIV